MSLLTTVDPHGLGIVDHHGEDGHFLRIRTDGHKTGLDTRHTGHRLSQGRARVVECRLDNGVVLEILALIAIISVFCQATSIPWDRIGTGPSHPGLHSADPGKRSRYRSSRP